jgi:hypothetical protein
MNKRLFFSISLVLVLCLASNASAGLKGWWNFDDGTADDSGLAGHDGTFMYDATTVIDGNVPGLAAGNRALLLDGIDDYVNCGGDAFDVADPCWGDFTSNAMTVACWTKLPDGYDNNYQPAIAKSGMFQWYRNYNGHGIRLYTNGTTDTYINYNCTPYPYVYLDDGEWHHTAATFDGVAGVRHIYIDGYHAAEESVVSGGFAVSTHAVSIGARLQYLNRWKGLLDEVRLYDDVEPEWRIRMWAANNEAYNPVPEDGAINQLKTLAQVSWSGLPLTADYRVYLGTSFADVNNGDASVDKGVVAGGPAASYSGAPMGALTLGSTYYWRVDANVGGLVTPGIVWEFSTKPAWAEKPYPFDGCKYVDLAKQLTWSAGDSAIKSEVFFSDNQQWVIDACDAIQTTITAPDPCVLSPTLAADTTYYWKVDSNDGTVYTPGNVWSFSTDTPSPEAGLVSYWPLDEKSGGSTVTWDISGNEHHGTLKPGEAGTSVDIVSDPDRGNVLECDNPAGHIINSVVICGGGNTGVDDDPCWAELQDRITLMGWTKVDEWHSTQYLMTRGAPYQMTMNNSNGNLRTYWNNLTDLSMVLDRYQYGYINLTDGEWHHVAMTYDNGVDERKVYTDGKLQSTEAITGQLGTHAGGFVIGGRDQGGYQERGWDGLIDDVKLYDRALAGWEIRAYVADCATCVGDLDANNVVNLDDLNQLIGDLTMEMIATGLWEIPKTSIYWKNCSDMDSDGVITLKDLNRMIGNLTWEKLWWDNWYYPCGKYDP